MSQRVNKSIHSANTNKQVNVKSSTVGIVFKVILDDEYEGLNNTDSEDFSTGKDTSVIGSCVIREISDHITSEANLKSYRPLDPHNLDIPLMGETVELITIGNVKYYRRLSSGGLNKGNAKENFNKEVYPKVERQNNNAKSYSIIANTNTANSSQRTERDSKLGDYFQETQVNRLKLWEGDKLIQSRYGQSIRFSGYNNPYNLFAPTIHIRNRQNDVSIEQLKPGDITEEDVNRDGSTILITSGQYKIPFQPGVVDDGGSSNFESQPTVFTDYPKELVGTDQMLLNSGRIIISSKDSEMLFFSKGNYGFISDGIFSIDNGKGGANMDFNGDVKITTNDNNFYVFTEKGNIWLNTADNGDSGGTDQREPLVRGETLRQLLSDMIDLIVAQVYQTPSGPTAIGPTNQQDFRELKSRLNEILSTLNFTE